MIQMIKNILQKYLLFYVTMLHLFFITGNSAKCGQGSGSIGSISWEVNDGILTFSGIGEISDYFLSSPQFAGYVEDVEHIVIDSSISAIGGYAFTQCSLLKSIHIGATVTKIDDNSFRNNSKLRDILVDSDNPNYYSIDGILIETLNQKLIICPPAKTGIINVPEPVEIIGSVSFYQCKEVTSIILPSSLRSIESTAFFGSVFTSITVPATVTSLHVSAFDMCSKLVSIQVPNSYTSRSSLTFGGSDNLAYITVDDSHPFFSSIDGVLFSKDGKTLMICPTHRKGKYTVPNGVTTIAAMAFLQCNKLTSIIFSPTVTSIKMSAIDSCTGLVSVTIPESVSSIPPDAIYYSTAIREVICFRPDPPSVISNPFPPSVIAQSTLRVPSVSVGLYNSTDIWKDFKEIVAIEEKVTVDYNEIHLLPGSTTTINAELTGGAANPKVVVTWNSREPQIATVDNKGKLTAVHPGTTVITASNGEEEGECRVLVIEKGRMSVDRAGTKMERAKLYEK